MQKWGLSTTILGTIALGILGILGILVMEHSTPERSVSDTDRWDSERLKRELERERMALDSL
ncbi:MAG: hypothetical protein ACR2RV_12245, partial [Verrucomicrobiales bacterium]